MKAARGHPGIGTRVNPPANGEQYISRLPLDPWGNPYFYQSDGNNYVLKSFGADGVEGGDGKNADIDASQF